MSNTGSVPQVQANTGEKEPVVGFAWSCLPCNTVRYKLIDIEAARESLATHGRDKHHGALPNNAYVFPHTKSGKPAL